MSSTRIYLEDIAEGTTFESARRTVTEADIVGFAGISGDFDQLHMDEPFVREHTPFKGRIAHGLLVLAIQSGLRCEILDWQLIAYLGEERRFTAPTYPGDTLHARYEVREVRRSASRPGAGVVRLWCEVVNQHDEIVQAGEDVMLVAARSGVGPPES